jgi:hypothetical protein
MLEVPKREIIIKFLKFILNIIILKHFNYPRIIQNIVTVQVFVNE